MEPAASAAQSSITVEDYVFPPSVRPPASDKSFSLAGAGVRGLMIEGKFITFTCSGIYLDAEVALPSLALKWKGKSADELALSVEFFRDIVTEQIAFGKHDVVKGVRGGVIENGPLSQAFLESIIGKNGVSPATRKSLANRVQELLNTYQVLE